MTENQDIANYELMDRSKLEAGAVAFYSAETYQPEQSIGFLAGRLRNLVSDAIDQTLKGKGLNSRRFGVLHAIFRGMAKSPTELAQLRYQDKASVTYTLNILEEKSLLTRKLSLDDRRSTNLELTEEGESLTRECIPLVVEAQNRVLAPLDNEEYRLLSSLLQKLVYGEGQPAPVGQIYPQTPA